MDSNFDMVEMMEKYNIVLKRVPDSMVFMREIRGRIEDIPEGAEVVDCIWQKCTEKQFNEKRQKNPSAFINDYWKNGYHIRKSLKMTYTQKGGWMAKSVRNNDKSVTFIGTEPLCETAEEAVKSAVDAEVKRRKETNAMYEKAGLPLFYTEL